MSSSVHLQKIYDESNINGQGSRSSSMLGLQDTNIDHLPPYSAVASGSAHPQSIRFGGIAPLSSLFAPMLMATFHIFFMNGHSITEQVATGQILGVNGPRTIQAIVRRLGCGYHEVGKNDSEE